ncbi:MAG: hypothetical protein Q9222_003796, partial [Ikaeria aurantiellina]
MECGTVILNEAQLYSGENSPDIKEKEFSEDLESSVTVNDDAPGVPDEHPSASDSESDAADNESVASDASDDSEMEPFVEYQTKIEQLLSDIGLSNFDITVIQHDYSCQNCVYGLTPRDGLGERYVLRVPVCPEYPENSNRCTAILNSVALLEHLNTCLPVAVPRVKAYSITADNALAAPFTIETRLPGISLNQIYDELTTVDQLSIIDQTVELIAKLESIKFTTAGTFEPSSPLPDSSNDYTSITGLKIAPFNEGDEEWTKSPASVHNRAGTNLNLFLTDHISSFLVADTRGGSAAASHSVPALHRMHSMLSTFIDQGAFNDLCPIILDHCDLEPRNMMVQQLNTGTWQITGVIDWDDALALPRPLTRKPHNWIWDYDAEVYTGYYNCDHQPTLNMTPECLAWKEYYDGLAAAKLDGDYMDDAYGTGSWLRRIWLFARRGLYSMWYLELEKRME